MNFRVGQKVCCVKKGGWQWVGGDVSEPSFFPIHGQIYTVASKLAADGTRYLALEEIPLNRHGQFCWFQSKFFRPLVTRKTSIDWAIAILNGSPVKEGV